MNLSDKSTTYLINRLHTLERLWRTANDHNRDVIALEHKALRNELNSRPTDAVVEALRH